ncbi:MAG: hypothetical protein RQ856_03305 [Candidatus Izemoplasmatales bacterium]|nr:hypothetical protein [Candidatus Izemoplasmatales bacterium]
MFEVFTNSIVYPKNIINYHNKKGGFVFLYILVLVLLMSISTVVFYISIKPTEITTLNSGCEVIENNLICVGENYDINNKFDVYDFDVYLLEETAEVSDINDLGDFTLILQGETLTIVVGDQTVNSMNFLSRYGISTLEEAIAILKFSIISAGITMGVISNTIILLFIVFISTIPFLRFRSMISYKKIFKMLVFAATPMAFLFAVYNLLNFDMFIFFILMLFAYRSVFALQKELHFRVLNKSGGGYVNLENDKTEVTEEDDENDEEETEDDSDDDFKL